MGSISGDSSIDWDHDSSAQEEKIFVSVRLRPMNERELGRNDVSDWECINNTTIIFKNSLQERSMYPAAYTFDRVFGSDSSTREVYEEAAKKIALSVLSGMNSSIFAYGQTSSGKTYTMAGITENTIDDIYDYIDNHREREFVLKFSAMEIYNESVKDLLSIDGTPLRLLDDPERGTVVEKLTEVSLRDKNHLKELLSICEAQRQIGETTLNEMSSRSHQILRLSVDSIAREYFGVLNSSTLTASVNFVDLAGSERASQTLSAGTRLKEGCHINRSLLTLGTVIRKLSKGRNGHIPYRDSKLTRILQNSLGGNAKTAIICTVSPAHSHVEQSRNTLLFASCAKQVSTNAQVNVVMSEKALVKQLQKELARLENELRNLSSHASSCDSAAALKEKEQLIEKMDKEIRELTYQRDQAQFHAENMLKSGGEYQASKSWLDMNHEKGSWRDEYSASEASEIIDPFRSDGASITSHFSDRCERVNSRRIGDQFVESSEEQFLSDDTSPRLYIDKYFGPDPCQGWEKIGQETDKCLEESCKELQCIEINFPSGHTVSNVSSEQNGDLGSGKHTSSSDTDVSDFSDNVSRSVSCAAILNTITKASSFEGEKDPGNTSPIAEDTQGKISIVEPMMSTERLSTKDDRNSKKSDSMNENDHTIKIFDEDHNIKILDKDCPAKKQEVYATELSEAIQSESVKQMVNDLQGIKEAKTTKNSENNAEDESNKSQNIMQSPSDWFAEFERQKREITELWNTCNIPLVHRTYFFLLFKGDPSDAVYIEVELRRLSFLKNTLHGLAKDDHFTLASSAKTLNREREMLGRRMIKKYSAKEREALYKKWGIGLKTKQRRLQLCRKLWTDAANLEHIKESAYIVAKLIGFKETGKAPKEMFGLSVSTKLVNLSSSSWRHSLPSMI
ncbi:kinesin-like protein KIN-7F [Primulina huaijiensis]|uniref:kinesin-like protein KIN-7F n=1 Tax=Primulina huaijiensis TaxID=1492673 RepID=UPI003CC786D3